MRENREIYLELVYLVTVLIPTLTACLAQTLDRQQFGCICSNTLQMQIAQLCLRLRFLLLSQFVIFFCVLPVFFAASPLVLGGIFRLFTSQTLLTLFTNDKFFYIFFNKLRCVLPRNFFDGSTDLILMNIRRLYRFRFRCMEPWQSSRQFVNRLIRREALDNEI